MEMRQAFADTYNRAYQSGYYPVFLTPADLRQAVFSMLERDFSPKNFAVLSHEEVPPDAKLELKDQVGIGRAETQEQRA